MVLKKINDSHHNNRWEKSLSGNANWNNYIDLVVKKNKTRVKIENHRMDSFYDFMNIPI